MIRSRRGALLSLNPKLYVITGIIATVTAQILLKKAGSSSVFKLKWFLFMFLSLGVYSISFLSYYVALKHFEISTIQPIMMVSIVGLISVYGFAAGERFTYLKVLGVMLAALSVFLMSKS